MKAIMTRYTGPTNTRGSRIVTADSDDNRVSIPYSSDLDTEAAHAAAAVALCAKMKWRGGLIAGATKDGYAFVFEGGNEYNVPVVTVPHGADAEIDFVLDEVARLVAQGHGQHVALVIAAARLIEVLGEAG